MLYLYNINVKADESSIALIKSTAFNLVNVVFYQNTGIMMSMDENAKIMMYINFVLVYLSNAQYKNNSQHSLGILNAFSLPCLTLIQC